MRSEKPNFLSQPIVKNVFMFRNGDPYYEARRIVINQKRISNFETLLREVTGGIQAPFGAVRNIYTPTGGHRVRCMESLRSGEQYVAAGRERFKRLDYDQIGSRRKRMMQALPMQAKPPPQNRIIVSARFLKPIREPCPIFVVANGDVLDPATRLLIHQKMLSQFDRILEMVTEKMGLKVLGGVRSLYTYGGHQVTDGNQLESGQLYVAVGRDRFKMLPYSDLLFTKPRGTRRYNGMKAHSLPPIYRFSKQNGNNKSVVRSSDSGDGDSKNSPPRHNGSNKEHLSSIVREISQARLISLRKKRSGQSMTFSISDNADLESKADDGITEDKIPQDQPVEEKTAADDPKAEEGSSENAVEEEEEEAAIKNTTDDDSAASKEEKQEEDMNENDENKCEKDGEADEEVEEEVKEATAGSGEKEEEVEEEVKEATAGSGEKEEEVEEEVKEEFKKEEHGSREEEVEEEVKEEVTVESKEGHMDGEQGSRVKEEELKEELRREVMNESKEEVKKHEQGSRSSNSDKTQDSKDKEDGNHPSSEREKDELDKTTEEEKEDKGSGKGQKTSVNDEGEGQKQKVMENSNDQRKTQSDNETGENDSRSSSSGNSNQEEDVSTTKEGHKKEAGEKEEGKIN